MSLDRRGLLCGLIAAGVSHGATAAARRLPQPDPVRWDPQGAPLREGEAVGPNGPVYFRCYGRPGRTPVIVLHGGPAAGHRYLRAYAALATDRQVILYDQSGCGRSGKPADLALYTPDRYVAELEALRAHLRLERVVLLGHSWGGMLALAYASAHPDRVEALVLAGTAPRWADFSEAATRWLQALGPDAVETVREAEASGRTDGARYGVLLERYYRLHLCRLDPWPAWFAAEGETLGRNPVYAHLNGPSEFQFTGALAAYDLRARLKTLRLPTLVTCGEFDEAPPFVGRRLAALIPGAVLHTFDGLSHMSHIEDPARVISVTARFLSQRA